MLLLLYAQQRGQPDIYKAPDSSFALNLPASLRALDRASLQDFEFCDATDLACFEYSPATKAETRSISAALEVRATSAKDRQACNAPNPIRSADGEIIPASPASDLWINGLKWSHGYLESAGGGHFLTENLYQTWHAGNCWLLSLNIYTQIMDPPPDAAVEEGNVFTLLNRARRSFRFLR